MVTSCQGDFKEETEKLVRFFLYTTENWWRKEQPSVHNASNQ